MPGWDEKSFAKFTYISDVRVSPRGDVAYVLTKARIDLDKYENTIVIHGEGCERYIDDATMPRFSFSGRYLGYVRVKEDEKKTQLFVADLETMSSRKIGEFKNVRQVEWGPDDRSLLVVGFKRREDDDYVYDSEVPVWFDRMGFFDGERVQVQIYDALGGEVLEVFEAPRFTSAIWHGRSIVYACPRSENPLKLYDVIQYSGGIHEKILERVSLTPADSDGKTLLLEGKPLKKFLSEHSYLYRYRDGQVEPLTEGLGLATVDGKLDEGKVYFRLMDAGKIALGMLGDSGVERLVDEAAWVTSYDVACGRLALVLSSDTTPGELYIYERELQRVTSYNDAVLEKLKPRRYTHFKYASFDGAALDGWYLKPDIKNGEKAPVVVFVHGGPKGMYGYHFDVLAQMLADRGFYVLFTNPRGSGGYSEEFALKVIGRTGLEDFQDILKGLEWLLSNEPTADPDRVGITGISYGGFMTNWAVTQTDIFKAAVSENGISYWLTSYAFSDIGLWFDKELIGEAPLENDNYRKLSPLFYADRVRTPILLIHSLEDYRCPLDQSIMFYHVLKDFNKEAYIVVFKRGAHGHSIMGKPKHRMKRYKLITSFFYRKLVEAKEGFNVDEASRE